MQHADLGRMLPPSK